jgi:hypothetical protein
MCYAIRNFLEISCKDFDQEQEHVHGRMMTITGAERKEIGWRNISFYLSPLKLRS